MRANHVWILLDTSRPASGSAGCQTAGLQSLHAPADLAEPPPPCPSTTASRKRRSATTTTISASGRKLFSVGGSRWSSRSPAASCARWSPTLGSSRAPTCTRSRAPPPHAARRARRTLRATRTASSRRRSSRPARAVPSAQSAPTFRAARRARPARRARRRPSARAATSNARRCVVLRVRIHITRLSLTTPFFFFFYSVCALLLLAVGGRPAVGRRRHRRAPPRQDARAPYAQYHRMQRRCKGLVLPYGQQQPV